MYMSWFNFILGLIFISLCFKLVIIYYHAQKQREIKIKPRIKLNHNIYQWDKPDGYMPCWWAPIRAKQLSIAATAHARVIWLCACVRYWYWYWYWYCARYTVGWRLYAPCFKFVAYKWAFVVWLCRSACKVFPDSFFETMVFGLVSK